MSKSAEFAAANEEALRRIADAHESSAEILDLGDLQLESLPSELRSLTALRTLALGTNRPILNDGRLTWEFDYKRPWQAIPSLEPLADLRQLQSFDLRGCKAITDLSALATLQQLQSLDLSWCTEITDLSALATLQQLQSLNLSRCTEITDLSALATLQQLQSLDLCGCTGIASIACLLPLFDGLIDLNLYQCQLQDFPEELCGDQSYDNVIGEVRAHFRDIALGESKDAEVKLCILGNGSVGKTQISRQLQGLPYDPHVPTTHGVQLGHFEMTIDGQGVRLNLWDFGGQDIYHGSHALFLSGRAVFIIAWTPRLETGEFIDGGTSMANRPLRYWLDYLQGLAGNESPVLVVQAQCDETNQRQKPQIPTDDFRALRPLSCSAKTGLGLTVLRGELEDAVRDLQRHKPPVRIGAGRVAVRNQLRALLEEDQQSNPTDRRYRMLSQEFFRKLCDTTGKVSSPEALLDYLHHTGVVYYRQGMFDDRIILDQTWALEAIYALFDRARTLPVLNSHGRFTRRELELLVWKDFSPGEQEIFLSMMQSCGICFPVRNVSSDEHRPEWEYLAPELLPPWSIAQDWLLGRMQGGPDDANVEVGYRFLHEGILRELLSRLGKQAGDSALYWKYGCWFFEKKSASQILIRSKLEANSGDGTILLRAVGERPQELLEVVLKVLLQIPCGASPLVKRSWVPDFRDRDNEREHWLDRIVQLAIDEGSGRLDIAAHPELPAAARPSIYVSYAWGDDTRAGKKREEAVVGLCGKLEHWGYEVIKDDRVLRPGDWISTFMRAIGRDDHVLVIISDKYLKSPTACQNCFRSLTDPKGPNLTCSAE